MTARDRLEQAAVMFAATVRALSSSARTDDARDLDEQLDRVDRELRDAAIAFDRALAPRQLQRVRRYGR